ncbi:LemA family protein [Patescibacteria group bacterium]|nr:LemA family protein [Patescibacteria group bacterium]MBU1931448.1 LemA family protein [Patescibacteria group bacterium]
MKKTLLIILAVAVFIGFSLVGTYNNLVQQNQAVEAQWAQVETQYQRRFDLIPNLVNSVKGLFDQEQTVFGDIAEARTRYSGATTVDAKAQAAGQVESALARLLVIVENYPDIKSDQATMGLMDELAGTENRVSVERKRFNDLVRTYNTNIKQFPTNLIARLFGFSPKAYFEAVEAAEQAPEVNFGD